MTQTQTLDLEKEIEALFDAKLTSYSDENKETFSQFRTALSRGEIRSAEPDPSSKSGWKVNAWVKKGILLGFKIGTIVQLEEGGLQPFFDKSTYPLKTIILSDGVRVVPGGTSIRETAYLAPGVVCMPPSYINVGAYVGEGTMVDSHVLVGSCAQIGKSVHLSAAVQIGGVLEPIGASPVIIEDHAMVGGNSGIYEGTVVKEGAVIGTGTILNRSTPVYDLVTGEVHRATDTEPLIIPANAVVVPGSRAISTGKGAEWGLSLQTPIIVKYRDSKTDSRIQLEDFLRKS